MSTQGERQSAKDVPLNSGYDYMATVNCPSRGEIPNILKLAWGNAFGEVVAKWRFTMLCRPKVARRRLGGVEGC